MRRSTPKALRRSSRHSVRLACQVVRERSFQLVADQIVNLSSGGLLVMPADPALTGEPLLLSFQLPDSDRWVDAEVTVARVVHGRRPGEHTRGLALELPELEPSLRRCLQQALGRRPPAPPGNRKGRRAPVALGELIR